MITFTNKHNGIFDEETLSNAVEWYAKLKGIEAKTHKTIYIDLKGYLEVYIGGKHMHVPVHRLLMMYHLQRELKSNELVHHTDENILNCVLSNLELTNRLKHPRYHNERTDVLDSTIEEMLAQGKSQNDIARYFKCSDAAICHRVKRLRERKEICSAL